MKKSIIFLFTIVTGITTYAQKFDVTSIRQHVKILSADSMQGRGTGKEGERMAAAYIQQHFKKLKLQPKGDNKTYLQAFTFKAGAHGEGDAGIAHNIIGYLDNKAATTIIIGAHYDHLGAGDQGSSLDANPGGKIHNGADDNASGTTGVLELAEKFSSIKNQIKRSIIFITFSGEELNCF